MTNEALEQLWVVRLEGLRSTVAHAADYRECDQCRSIVPKQMGLCPWCHCYRFKEDAETVLGTLREMAKNPYPVTLGVVPRLSFPELGHAEAAESIGQCAWDRKR